MTTALEVINRAYRLIGIGAEGETLTGQQADDALNVFQGMVRQWRSDGLLLPDYNLALSAALTVDDADWLCLADCLAILMAPEFAVEPSPTLMRNAVSSKTMLRHRYFVPAKVDFSELPSSVNRNFGNDE